MDLLGGFSLNNIPSWVWTALVILIVFLWWKNRKKGGGK